MLRFEPFRAEHLDVVAQRSVDKEERALVREQFIGGQLERYLSWSVWADEACICCAGIVPLHTHRSFVWGMLSVDAAPHMRALTRYARQVFADYPVRRLEITVLPEFEAAARWAEMLGFRCEAKLQAYDDLGRDVLMYARIR